MVMSADLATRQTAATFKALALIQVAYLIIQLVARKVEDLRSTQVEIATLAFSASSTVTYLL